MPLSNQRSFKTVLFVHLNWVTKYTGGWDKIIGIRVCLLVLLTYKLSQGKKACWHVMCIFISFWQELFEDDSELELRDVVSITCDSIITLLLSSDERLIVGLSNREIKVNSILLFSIIYLIQHFPFPILGSFANFMVFNTHISHLCRVQGWYTYLPLVPGMGKDPTTLDLMYTVFFYISVDEIRANAINPA
jgi:hypothetical protein